MATRFAPIEGKHNVLPHWGQGCALPRQFLLLPLPRSGLVGLASPWRVRLWSVRPWLASPGGSGVPSLCLCFFPPFLCFCFVPSSGSARVSRVVELPWPSMAQVWQRVCTRSFEATAQVFRKEPPPATRTPPTFDQIRKRGSGAVECRSTRTLNTALSHGGPPSTNDGSVG